MNTLVSLALKFSHLSFLPSSKLSPKVNPCTLSRAEINSIFIMQKWCNCRTVQCIKCDIYTKKREQLPSLIFVTKPSTVVTIPPNVPLVSSNSISGIITLAVSDWHTKKKLNVINLLCCSLIYVSTAHWVNSTGHSIIGSNSKISHFTLPNKGTLVTV